MRDRAVNTAAEDASLDDICVAHITTVDSSLRFLLLGLLTSLADAGCDVVGISAPGPDVPVLEASGIRHIAVPMTRRAFAPLQDLRALYQLYRVLRCERFTIVHTHTPKAGLLGRVAARLARVPIIVHTNHGFVFHERSPWLWRRFFVALEKIGAECCDLVFSVNHEDVKTAVREGICGPGKIMPLGEGGIGVDTSRFAPGLVSSHHIAQLRSELGLPVDARIVGFVGRLVREKGLPELLEAARLVHERVPEARFLIVGPVDGAKPDAITPDAADRYGISDICVFTGQRQDTPALYALMDVFALPSHREGFPLVLAEAAASQVPVIATDIRGCREAVENGRNGMLVPLGDVQALAGAISELLMDRDRAQRMGEEGRHIALERFDQRLVFEKVKAEYRRLLLKKGL